MTLKNSKLLTITAVVASFAITAFAGTTITSVANTGPTITSAAAVSAPTTADMFPASAIATVEKFDFSFTANQAAAKNNAVTIGAVAPVVSLTSANPYPANLSVSPPSAATAFVEGATPKLVVFTEGAHARPVPTYV